MDERRSTRRKRVLKGAFILVSEKAPKLECFVRDISETGAWLHVATTFGLPNRFDLVAGVTRKRCCAQWRTDNDIGVVFEVS